MKEAQLVSLYEQGLEVEEISQAFPELAVESIKMALTAGSAKYRQKLEEGKENFSEADKLAACKAMRSLLGAEKESVVFHAAKYIIDDKAGRHSTITNLRNAMGGVSVTVLNLHLTRAQEAIKKARGEVQIQQEAIAA